MHVVEKHVISSWKCGTNCVHYLPPKNKPQESRIGILHYDIGGST